MERKSKRAIVPFTLAYWPGWICAQGPKDLETELLTWPGASRSPDGFVYLPQSRVAFLAVESLANVASATAAYCSARATFMAVDPAEAAHVENLASATNLTMGLLPQQIEYCALALGRRSTMNASEQGTGKTMPAWLLPALWQCARVLIVTNASMVPQWGEELDLYWHENDRPFSFTGLHGASVAERAARLKDIATSCWLASQQGLAREPQAVAVNYETLADLRTSIASYAPDCVIFDESWKVANHTSKVWQAALSIVETYTWDARGATLPRVLELTGTPVGQSPATLWAQLRLLGQDVMALSYDVFLASFCKMETRMYGGWPQKKPVGAKNTMSLMQLIEPIYYRASQVTCGELPPQRSHLVNLQMGEQQLDLYEQVEEHGEAALCPMSLGGEGATNLRLHQIAGGFKPVPSNEGRAEYHCEPFDFCPKWEWLYRHVKDWGLDRDRTQRLLIWAAYTHELEFLRGMIGDWLGPERVAIVYKSVSAKRLSDIKSSFNSKSENGIQVIVAQLEKMAAGHNLQHNCTRAVYYSLNWRRITHSQSRKRIHRQGQTSPVDYYYLISSGVPEPIDQTIYDKHLMMEDLAERLTPHTVGGGLQGPQTS